MFSRVFISLLIVLLFDRGGQAEATSIRVELFDCALHGYSTKDVTALRTHCDTVQTLSAKPGGILTLTALVTDHDGKPLVGYEAWLEVTTTIDKPIHGALSRWRASKVAREVIDSRGVVSFSGLLLAWNLTLRARLALVVQSPEGEQLRAIFPIANVPAFGRLPSKLTELPKYVVIQSSPPRPEWHLTYDGRIPSGTVVRWYIDDGAELSRVREFTTREFASSLRLMGSKGKNVYTADDNACYTLVVSIGPPVSLVTATRLTGEGYTAFRCRAR